MNDPILPTSDVPASPKPYQAPALTDLGSIDVITAGPDTGGNIDMIYGGEGGFVRDSTS